MLGSPNSLSMFHAKDQEREKRIKRQKSRFFNLNYLNIKCLGVALFRNRYRRSRFGSILSPEIAFLKQNLYRYRYRFQRSTFHHSVCPDFLMGFIVFWHTKKSLIAQGFFRLCIVYLSVLNFTINDGHRDFGFQQLIWIFEGKEVFRIHGHIRQFTS